MEPRTLTHKELYEIDRLHSKANSILNEARQRLESCDWDLSVRRAQEAGELHTKTIFRFIGREYPRSHDLEKVIYEISILLQDYGVDRAEVARVVLANSTLGSWRLPSLYGDERLGIVQVFREPEARVAIGFAGEVRLTCEKVRAWLYRQASNSKG